MKHESLRIWRMPYSDFYKQETLHAAEKYTPGVLRGIAEAGFNAIWIHAILREVVPTKVFPEFSPDAAAHLRSMRTVIRRAEAEGIKVFIYAQPPRGVPLDDPFWERHPEVRGAKDPSAYHPAYAMCTSTPQVKEHLRQMAEGLTKRLPGLGGLILITASEYMAHCYTRHNCRKEFAVDRPPAPPLGCPRCRERAPQEVVGEIVTIFHDAFAKANVAQPPPAVQGAAKASASGQGDPALSERRTAEGGCATSAARVVAWNWSWTLYEPDPGEGVIAALPKGATLMCDFERGGHKVILGKERMVDEYSLSYAGPSERFLLASKAAHRRGMRTMAKLQIGTTHELATVPNLPLIGRLWEKARAMRKLGVRDFMGCWNFGNMLTANTAAFLRFFGAKRLPPRDRALADFAHDYFPGCDAQTVAEAWNAFEEAMDSYPFCIPFLYYSPTNYALAHPIEPKPLDGKFCGRGWMDDERGDDISRSFGIYTLNEIIKGMGQLHKRWAEGVKLLEAGLAGCEAQTAREELSSARAGAHSFRSAWNLYRAYKIRKDWSDDKKPKLAPIMKDELANLEEAVEVVRADDRLGFHIECQARLYTVEGIEKKIARLGEILAEGGK